MGDRRLKLVYSIVLFLIASLAVTGYQLSLEQSQPQDMQGRVQIQNMYFYTSLDEAAQAAMEESKPLFIYVRSETCGWCRKFEAETFTDEQVTSTLQTHFVSTVLNIQEDWQTIVKYGVRGTPTMIFLNSDGGEITRIQGYVPTEEFMQQLTHITTKRGMR
jgi:thioredoxin-related protein